jgi:septal ring factor EnvC (AmiA/AmiB activator)
MSGIMAFKNRKKIKELQDAINKLEEEIKKVEKELGILNKKIADYKKKEITPLERKALTAAFADAGFAIRNYLLIMVEIWWWTIIGAIIDICLVIPTIAILYSSGALKGSLGKKIEKELSKKKRVFKAMEKTRRPLERQIFRFRQEQQQLAQQQFQLTQLFKLEQQQAAAGGPPSPGGIPLAS